MLAWDKREDRLRELILYVSEQSASNPRFGAVKLNKVLFYSDFLAYLIMGWPITAFEYQRLQRGPVPRGIHSIKADMESAGEIAVRTIELTDGKIQKRVVPLRRPDLSCFSPEQIDIVNGVIEQLQKHDADQVSEMSHGEVGWIAADMHESIPYGSVCLSAAPLTPAEMDRIRSFAMENGYGQA